MFGWLKKKEEKPSVRFYSLEPGVLELFPIVPSSKLDRQFLIEEQIGDVPEALSSKNCPGIKKIVNVGWIVPAPADFIIKTNGDGISFDWAEPYRFHKGVQGYESYVSSHTRSQAEPLLDDPTDTLKTVVKIETPWRFETSDDIVFLQVPVTYNNERRFTSATGILDPKYGHTLNVQLFWKVLDDETLVRAGTPLCQLIPISRKHLNMGLYDTVIESADAIDQEKEKAFTYAANCVILNHDNLGSRLKRAVNILSKYKTKRRSK